MGISGTGDKGEVRWQKGVIPPRKDEALRKPKDITVKKAAEKLVRTASEPPLPSQSPLPERTVKKLSAEQKITDLKEIKKLTQPATQSTFEHANVHSDQAEEKVTIENTKEPTQASAGPRIAMVQIEREKLVDLASNLKELRAKALDKRSQLNKEVSEAKIAEWGANASNIQTLHSFFLSKYKAYENSWKEVEKLDQAIREIEKKVPHWEEALNSLESMEPKGHLLETIDEINKFREQFIGKQEQAESELEPPLPSKSQLPIFSAEEKPTQETIRKNLIDLAVTLPALRENAVDKRSRLNKEVSEARIASWEATSSVDPELFLSKHKAYEDAGKEIDKLDQAIKEYEQKRSHWEDAMNSSDLKDWQQANLEIKQFQDRYIGRQE